MQKREHCGLHKIIMVKTWKEAAIVRNAIITGVTDRDNGPRTFLFLPSVHKPNPRLPQLIAVLFHIDTLKKFQKISMHS